MHSDKMSKIPKNTLFCYKVKENLENGVRKIEPCPYLTYKKTDYGIKIKGVRKERQQYCKLYHKFLSDQDFIKDCGIGLEGEDDE